MPSNNPLDDDYECTVCWNNSPTCGCIKPVFTEAQKKDILKVYRRAQKGSFESRFKAKAGDFTYTKMRDGTIRYEQWTSSQGELKAFPFNSFEQLVAERVVDTYLLATRRRPRSKQQFAKAA